MATARIFRSGNSQAVRLPKQFRLTSKEVEIICRGDELVLRKKKRGLTRVFEILHRSARRHVCRGPQAASTPQRAMIPPRDLPIPTSASTSGVSSRAKSWRGFRS